MDLFSLEGKSALVTGGSRGIGKMIAEGFIAYGARVYILSRKKEELAQTAKELSTKGFCQALSGDVQSNADMAEAAGILSEKEGGIHILVNNAGAHWMASFEEHPDHAWEKLMDVNVHAVFNLTRRMLPLLSNKAEEGDPARIINIGSIAGMRATIMNSYSYSASKAALHQLTKVLAREFSPRRITVNAIAPALFPSKMSEKILMDPKLAKAVAEDVPLGRIGTKEDIAGLCVYLASRAGAFMTGNIIPLDGGYLVKH